MIKRFIGWLRAFLIKPKPLPVPAKELQEHEKPISGLDPALLDKARKYAHQQKQIYFAQMKKYGRSQISDRSIRRGCEEILGVRVQETNSLK